MAEAYISRRTSQVKRGEATTNSYGSLYIPDIAEMKNAIVSLKYGGTLEYSEAVQGWLSPGDILEIIIEDRKLVQVRFVGYDQSAAPTYVGIGYSANSSVVRIDPSLGGIFASASSSGPHFVPGSTYKYILY